ncbi:TIGR01777 family oxidoreductase [uncultured Bacteroides sp.]|uniref:TIGR01777 family oxidoreductase n=1 Tax=uncultured Bacteroides sp. TaxID=162156 RepID=UPI002AA7CC6B|nr:TIGR01777 family oxidoreductase [uncultured Bacteroides sp.]
MKIAISGASGFIGKHLTAFLLGRGHQVVPLGRVMFKDNMSGQLMHILSHCDVVINLAGATINRRWTAEYKKELYSSRIRVTRCIVKAINGLKEKPKLLISASAVGYYPTDGCFDEYSSERGTGFLSDLCNRWENEASKLPPQTRLVITRFGVVLSPDGGALQQMLRPLKMGLAVTIGPGTQPFPWIDIRDLNRIMELIIHTPSLKGAVNLVAPETVTQAQWMDKLALRQGHCFRFTMPDFFFRLLLGEAADFLTKGQCVRSARLAELGFTFSSPAPDDFLTNTDVRTVDELDLNRYMGKWYEIARFDHRFERNMVGVTAEYMLLPDGKVRVENSGYKNDFDGKHSVSVGKAKLPDLNRPGKLKVAFFLWFYGDYYVLELDKEHYGYALIGSSSDNYLWILSRTPQLSDEVKHYLLERAERRGYDVSKLIWVKQK